MPRDKVRPLQRTGLVTIRTSDRAAPVSTLLTSDALVADAPKEGEKKAGTGGGYEDMY
jgi:chaperonin GroEL